MTQSDLNFVIAAATLAAAISAAIGIALQLKFNRENTNRLLVELEASEKQKQNEAFLELFKLLNEAHHHENFEYLLGFVEWMKRETDNSQRQRWCEYVALGLRGDQQDIDNSSRSDLFMRLVLKKNASDSIRLQELEEVRSILIYALNTYEAIAIARTYQICNPEIIDSSLKQLVIYASEELRDFANAYDRRTGLSSTWKDLYNLVDSEDWKQPPTSVSKSSPAMIAKKTLSN